MKLLLFVLLALAVLSIGRHRVLEVHHHPAKSRLGIESLGANGCMAAFYGRRDGPGEIPAAFFSLQNSILCISFDRHKSLVLEWSGPGHLRVFLEIGRRTYA
jgi:hypothetical protein